MRSPISGPTSSVRQPQTAQWRMERVWKNEGATGQKRFERFKPRKRLNKPILFATGRHRLPRTSHGKEGVSVSSPEEGLKYLQIGQVCCPARRH
jgi:hypothetical protein